MGKSKQKAKTSLDRKKRTQNLTDFGSYLVNLRGKREGWSGFGSQQAAALGLKDLNLELSQSLLGKYESGRITDPNSRILHPLARLYKTTYLEIIAKLAQDKYRPPGGWTETERLMWSLIERIIAESKPTGISLDDLLRSRLQQLQLGHVLDVPAMAHWQKKANYADNLQQFWVVAPNFLDDEREEIFQTVRDNLNEGVEYCYFIYAHMKQRFMDLKQKLANVVKHDIAERIRAYALPMVAVNDDDREVSELLGTINMVANPHRPDHAKAYQCIREHGATVLASEMNSKDTRKLCWLLRPLTKAANRIDDIK